EGLELLQRSSSLRQLSLILPVVVTIAALSGHPLVAAGLSGSDGDPASSVHDAVSPARRLTYTQLVADLRCQLGDAEFERSAACGRRKQWNDVVRTAIDFLSQLCVELEPTQTGRTGQSPSSMLPLSRREREVLTLLADGSSNKEISQTLCISAKTVMHHTSSIYRKLGVRGRAGAAARIARGEV
ncbi:MAG: LuxR C-terminal-related transcriptional regulator, partial [Ilumatobacteraceae bacterium]